MSTLASRIAELTAGRRRGWQAELARACGVKPPSVADWVNGETKSLDGNNLLNAAAFFRVNPKWLQNGIGLKELSSLPEEQFRAPQQAIDFGSPRPDRRESHVTSALRDLGAALVAADPDARHDVLKMLEIYLSNPVNNDLIADVIAVRLSGGEQLEAQLVRRRG